MKRSILTLSILACLALFSFIVAQEKELDLTKYMNPFIGADGSGYTFPGPALPAGMVKVGPDCNKLIENAGWDAKGNIVDFYVNGDTAPGGRFNFDYTTK